MRKKKRILLSGAGGGIFPNILKFLEKKYNIFLTDSNDTIKQIYPDKNVIIVPLAKEGLFIKEMENIIENNRIEYYIPLIDEEIPKTFSLLEKFKDLKLICPNKRFVDLCLNKFVLAKELEEMGISKIETFLGNDFNFDIDFPIFIKPISSRGSRGAYKICNKDQFNAYFTLEDYKKEDIIIQNYIDGIEYTVSVVVNNLNKLIAVVPKRVIIKKGITINAITERNENIIEKCREIVLKLKPCGTFNVQLKIKEDQIKIFEINPRFSTTSILTCQAGINEFELSIESFNKKNIEYIDSFKENLYLFRRWENIFYEK